MTTSTFHGSQQSLNPSPVVYLYELDFNTCRTPSNTVLYVTPFRNGTENIVFGGQEYLPCDIWLDGITCELGGQLPSPRLQYRAKDKTDLVFQYARGGEYDIRMLTVRRIKTYANFLDGAVNADPSKKKVVMCYINAIDSRIMMDINFSMATNYGLEGINNKANRTLSTDTCALKYRIYSQTANAFTYTDPNDGGCPWGNPAAQTEIYNAVSDWGTVYFDSNDNPTANPAQDRCSLHLTGCAVRFQRANNTQPIPIEATFMEDTNQTGDGC